MKSVKEKSFELYPELRTDSDEWDVIEEQCDRDDQRKAFTKGANYVLEQIEEWLRITDYTSYKPAEHDLWVLIEQLKK